MTYITDAKPLVDTASIWSAMIQTWAFETRTWGDMANYSTYTLDSKPS